MRSCAFIYLVINDVFPATKTGTERKMYRLTLNKILPIAAYSRVKEISILKREIKIHTYFNKNKKSNTYISIEDSYSKTCFIYF